uniref:Uncharacterized protein n=1 Tax=Alexandrium catenella TaxID=2925 RepID=A0A7S1W0G2_ALECA
MALPDALLPPEESAQPMKRTRLGWLAAAAALSAGALSALALLSAGAEYGRATPHASAAYGVSLRSLNVSRAGGATALGEAALSSACYGYTGGTCHIEGCNPDRHAVCYAGDCVCPGPDMCSGADGRCYHARNVPVASGFTLTNKKYSRQKLMMPTVSVLGQLHTTVMPSFLLSGQDKFNLIRLMGTVEGKANYFLTTQGYPDKVATIRATAGTAFSLFGAYEVALWKEFGIGDLAVQVCSKGDGNIMIGSPGSMRTEWFYIHHASWLVYGTPLSDPGDSAIWSTDPPIHDGVIPVCL